MLASRDKGSEKRDDKKSFQEKQAKKEIDNLRKNIKQQYNAQGNQSKRMYSISLTKKERDRIQRKSSMIV